MPYAVTELLEGETLADRLRAGPLAPPRATEIACQIADGLAAAHAMGVIHRDIKPENIFLTNDGRAKILDFGIARIENPALRTGRSRGPRASSSSVFIVGTAGYISPEQVRGKRADPRSDIFALGAVYFEMLTGRRAFLRETRRRHARRGAAGRPAQATRRSQKIPEALRGFVFRCLEKDPADRYQTARDLLIDLRAWQAGAVKEAGARVQVPQRPSLAPAKDPHGPAQRRGGPAALVRLLGRLVLAEGAARRWPGPRRPLRPAKPDALSGRRDAVVQSLGGRREHRRPGAFGFGIGLVQQKSVQAS